MKYYFQSILPCLSAIAWVLCVPCGIYGSIVLLLCATLGLFWPMRRGKHLKQILIGISGVFATVGGIGALTLTAPDIPLWQWTLCWLLFCSVLLYCGQTPMVRAGVGIGLAASIVFFLVALLSISRFSGTVSTRGNIWWSDIIGGMILLGSVLSVRQNTSSPRGSFYGALTGALLCVIHSLLPSLVWSVRAQSVSSYPLLLVWRTVLLCPDVLLCGWCGLVCLWHSVRTLQILKK